MLTLLEKVKANLILSHNEDDDLLDNYIAASVTYAESYQHLANGYYEENPMLPTTEQHETPLNHLTERHFAYKKKPEVSLTGQKWLICTISRRLNHRSLCQRIIFIVTLGFLCRPSTQAWLQHMNRFMRCIL